MKRWPSESLREGRDTPEVWIASLPGTSPYQPLWDLQKKLWRARYEGAIPDTLLLLEHEPVVTLGRNARRSHLLLPEPGYRDREVELVEVDRGGDVTYHGPGQLVGYWIFDLRRLYADVHRFLREIEEVLIRTLARFGIEAGRSPGATGVWVGPRKIAAMGLHLSHWVSTHGFALNLDLDLEPFSWIVPCGLAGRGVTSLRACLGAEVRRDEVEQIVIEEMTALFRRRPVRVDPGSLRSAVETETEDGPSDARVAGAGEPSVREQRVLGQHA